MVGKKKVVGKVLKENVVVKDKMVMRKENVKFVWEYDKDRVGVRRLLRVEEV